MSKSLRTRINKINNTLKQYNSALLAFYNARESYRQAVNSAKLKIDLCNSSGLYVVNNLWAYPEVIEAKRIVELSYKRFCNKSDKMHKLCNKLYC